MAAVDVESLTITYGNVTAVDVLSFQAEAGEVTCVLGPNGAGKTSTVEALEGLRRPASGRLAVMGLDPQVDHRSLTERMGVMLQEGGIHPAVRAGEALRHAAALYRNPIDARELIDRLGLTGLERRTYRQLSGGEQRRLALALALVGRPQVAFLDEPTAGVDPAGRQVIRQVVADLRNDGVAVLLTTHDLDEAERVADRVVIVVEGRLVAAGTVDELTRSTSGDEQVRFRAPAGLDRESLALRLDGASIVETAPGDYVVAIEPTPRAVAAITAWLADHDLRLADLRAGRQRLEDVYLRLTAPAAAASRRDATEPSPGPPAGRSTERLAAQPDEGLDAPDPEVADGADEPKDVGASAEPEASARPEARDGADAPSPRPSTPASPTPTPTSAAPAPPASPHDTDRTAPTPLDHPDDPDDPAPAPPASPDDAGLTAATFEAFWGRRRLDSGSDEAGSTDWADWVGEADEADEAPAPGSRGRSGRGRKGRR
jgi:ABC-2 type transport system ATP-binding protein